MKCADKRHRAEREPTGGERQSSSWSAQVMTQLASAESKDQTSVDDTSQQLEARHQPELGQLQLQLLLDRLIPAIWPQPASSDGEGGSAVSEEQEDGQDLDEARLGQHGSPADLHRPQSPPPTQPPPTQPTTISRPNRIKQPLVNGSGEHVQALGSSGNQLETAAINSGGQPTKRPSALQASGGFSSQKDRFKPIGHVRAPYDTPLTIQNGPFKPLRDAPVAMASSLATTAPTSPHRKLAVPASSSQPNKQHWPTTTSNNDQDQDDHNDTIRLNRLGAHQYHHQHQQHHLQQDPMQVATTNSVVQEPPAHDPIRQLVSFQANNLYYPPNEFSDTATGGVNANNNAAINYQPATRPLAHHYQQQQPEPGNWPATSLYHLSPSSWQLSQQQQQPYYGSGGSSTNNNYHLSAGHNQLQWPGRHASQLGAAGSQTIIGPASSAARPSGAAAAGSVAASWLASLLGQTNGGGGTGAGLVAYPTAGAAAVSPNPGLGGAIAAALQPPSSTAAPSSSSALANLVAFLANNKATLSNLIQLLPLVAQTIRTLPKVLAAGTQDGSSANNLLYHLAGGGQAVAPGGSIEPSTTVAVSGGGKARQPANDQQLQPKHQQQQPPPSKQPHHGLVQTLPQQSGAATTRTKTNQDRLADNVLAVATSSTQSSGSAKTNLANRFKQPAAGLVTDSTTTTTITATGSGGGGANRRTTSTTGSETGPKLEGSPQSQQQQQQESMTEPVGAGLVQSRPQAAGPGAPAVAAASLGLASNANGSGSQLNGYQATTGAAATAAVKLMISELVRRWLTTASSSDGLVPTRTGQQQPAASPLSSGIASGLAEALLKQYLQQTISANTDRTRPNAAGELAISAASIHHQLPSILAGLLQQQQQQAPLGGLATNQGLRAPAGVGQLTNWLVKSFASALAQ